MIDINNFKIHTLKDGRKVINLLLGPIVFSDGTRALAQDKDLLDQFKTRKVETNLVIKGLKIIKVETRLNDDQLTALKMLQNFTDIVLTPRTILDALANLGGNVRVNDYYKCLGQRDISVQSNERIVDVNSWIY